MVNKAEIARLAYAEHIIRCSEQDPEKVEELLSLDGDLEKAWKWMALAYAKREGDPDKIRGLIVYLLSNLGKLDTQKRKWLIDQIEAGKIKFADMTYEMLQGTKLEWVHIFKLVGKEFNPTREKERVRRIYERLAAHKGKGVQ